jgi:serine/threonine protein kinase
MASHEQEREQRDVAQSDLSESALSTSREKRPSERILSDGLRFGNYKVVRLIAVGGMSEVYEAIHVALRKRVALKVMRPDLAESAQAQRSFLAEGMNAARIRHTNVVDVTDVGVVGELPYLVMSLLEGEDLAAAYARQGRFQTADLVDLLLPVAFAVAIGHCHGVVHRDLKPGNIFLHQEGCRLIPKVLDFGVSRLLGALRTKTPGRVFGTPLYMAPEQARGEPSDTRADQYALGVMLYQGLTGRLPRDADDAEKLLHTVAYDSSPFAPPSRYVELPAALEGAICRAMSFDPEQRFASMHDLARVLLPFASPEACRYWTEELNSLPNIGPNGRAVAPVTRRRSQPPRPSVPPMPMRIEQSAAGEQLAAPSTLKSAAPPSPIPQPAAAESPLTAEAREPTARFAPDWPQLQVVDAGAAHAASFAKRHRKALGLAGAALLALGGIWLIGSSSGGGTTTISSATAPPVPTRSGRYIDVDVRITPATAVLMLDERQVAVGHYTARLLHDDTTHELRAVAEGFVTRSLWFRDEAPPRVVELVPVSGAPAVAATTTSHPTYAAASKPAALRKPPRKSVVAAWQPRATAQLSTVDSARNSNDSIALQSPYVNVVELQQPKIRVVDDEQPRVRVIE